MKRYRRLPVRQKAHVLSFTVIAASLLLQSCGDKKEDASKAGQQGPKAISVEGFVVRASPFSTEYTTTGNLIPSEAIDIHPEISGRVTAILFKEGTRVSKGQTLLTISDADVKAGLAKLRAQRAQQAAILTRSRELVRIGGISKQDYEASQTSVQSVDADIAYQQELLRRTRVIAPFSGIVGLRGISVGAVVTPATTVASLQQTQPLKLDVSLPEQYRETLRPGATVRFWVTGVRDTFEARVNAVEPGATATTRTVTARAIVANPNGVLAPGEFAHVIVPIKSEAATILIPAQAVIPTTRDKKVAVIRNGRANLTTVILGTRTAESVEIVQGLQPGDTVALTGLMQIKDSTQVKIGKVVRG